MLPFNFISCKEIAAAVLIASNIFGVHSDVCELVSVKHGMMVVISIPSFKVTGA